jgi:5-methylcytosine-specific restriction endonuclease McrA
MRRLANIEKRRQQYKKWLQKNPNWRKNYDLANKERIKKRCRIWYQLNRAKAIDKARRYDARKRASRKAALTPACFADVGGRFAVFNNCCAYCGSKDRLEVDHVVALSRGGLDEPSNIIPACRSCNGSKNARPIESWYRRQPFFTEARWRKIQRHCPAAVAGQLPLALPA